MASNTNNQNAPDINTGYPGFIYNFNPDTQLCEVQLALESLFVGTIDSYTLETKQRLEMVPVQFTQGGGWSITHPIPDGTPCYVHFAQRGIDHWLMEAKANAGMVNGAPAPAFSQLFSHLAATCTVGNQPVPKAIQGFQPDAFEVRNADRSVRSSYNPDGSIEILTGAAKITITKDTEIVIDVTSKATIKAPQILLDGDTTISKSLTVLGGITASGGDGGTFKVTGEVVHSGSYKLNGVEVDGHVHVNPEGGNVGPMIAG